MSTLNAWLNCALPSSNRQDVCMVLKTALEHPHETEASLKVKKSLNKIKRILCGAPGLEAQPDHVLFELSKRIVRLTLLPMLITNLKTLDPQGKKNVADIFSNVLHRTLIDLSVLTDTSVKEELLSQCPECFNMLFKWCDDIDLTAHCSYMLSQSARHEALAEILLNSPLIFSLFNHMASIDFVISASAFAAMRDLLLAHTALVASFLTTNYDAVFSELNTLCDSPICTSRQMAMKLLMRLLLESCNSAIKQSYFEEKTNLKLIMQALRDTDKRVQYDSYLIFQALLHEPVKSPPVQKILRLNEKKIHQLMLEFKKILEERFGGRS